ncbi:MAG: hypothetical protein JWM74_1829 [Myxococcaceae bacterium]|nr:hypothetical protein [Myxococcaceae bacterium]
MTVSVGVGVVAIALLLWIFGRRNDVPAGVDAAAATSTRVDDPNGTPLTSITPERLREARRQRDEMRQKIYASFGQTPPPDKPPAPANANGSTGRGGGTGAGAFGDAPPLADAGAIDRAYVQSRIREDFMPMAAKCYEAALVKQPRLAGRLSVKFVIVGDDSTGGIVDSAELDEASTLTDPQLAFCMLETMKSMTFKPPQKGGWVSVTYPFLLSPDGPDDSGED